MSIGPAEKGSGAGVIVAVCKVGDCESKFSGSENVQLDMLKDPATNDGTAVVPMNACAPWKSNSAAVRPDPKVISNKPPFAAVLKRISLG